jgi:hypothetical protein
MNDAEKHVVDLALQFPSVIQSMREYQDMTTALQTLKKYEDKYGKVSK